MKAEDYLAKMDACVARMPQLPPTIGKIMAICNDPQGSPAELNRAISIDPVLTARVLKLINSAYYGMRQEISSLVRAVVMLGMNTIKNLALSSAIMSTMGKHRRFGNLDPTHFWRHCLGVGAVCRTIAQTRGIPSGEQEEFFIMGLLHDLGKILLNSCFTDDYGRLLSSGESAPDPLHVRESKLFGRDHAAVGRMILERWNLRSRVAAAVGGHHDPLAPEFRQDEAAAVVAVADDYVNYCRVGNSGAQAVTDLQPELLGVLGLDHEFFQSQRERLLKEIALAMVFLEVQ